MEKYPEKRDDRRSRTGHKPGRKRFRSGLRRTEYVFLFRTLLKKNGKPGRKQLSSLERWKMSSKKTAILHKVEHTFLDRIVKTKYALSRFYKKNEM